MDALPCQLGVWGDAGIFRHLETVAAFGKKLDHVRIVSGGVLGLDVADGYVPFGIDPVPAVAHASLEVDPAEAGLPVSHQMNGVDVSCRVAYASGGKTRMFVSDGCTEGIFPVTIYVRAEHEAESPVVCPGGVAVVFQVPVMSLYVCPEETVRFRCLQ